MSTKPWWEQTWRVEGCGNPEHGPDWKCHRVMDEQDQRVIGNVDLATATRHAAAPDMARALLAVRRQDTVDACWCEVARDIFNYGHGDRCVEARAVLTKAGIPLP